MRVHDDVALPGTQVQAEGHGVHPEVAVGELDAFRPGRGPGRVVDRGGGVLVRGSPGPRRDVEAHRQRLALGAEHDAVRGPDVAQGLVELGVDEQHRGPAVLDGVAHLVRTQPEVDGHGDAAARGHGVQQLQQPGGVLAHDGDALARAHAQRVQAGLPGPHAPGELAVGRAGHGHRGLVRLVDDGDGVGEDGLGAVQEVVDGQGDEHGSLLWVVGCDDGRKRPASAVTRKSLGFARREHGRREGSAKTTDSLVIGACRPAYRPSACPHHPVSPRPSPSRPAPGSSSPSTGWPSPPPCRRSGASSVRTWSARSGPSTPTRSHSPCS